MPTAPPPPHFPRPPNNRSISFRLRSRPRCRVSRVLIRGGGRAAQKNGAGAGGGWYGGARRQRMMHGGERAALHAALVALAVAAGVAGALAAAEAAAEMPEPLRRLQQVQMNLWQRACGTAALDEGIGCWWNNYGWGAIMDSLGF